MAEIKREYIIDELLNISQKNCNYWMETNRIIDWTILHIQNLVKENAALKQELEQMKKERT